MSEGLIVIGDRQLGGAGFDGGVNYTDDIKPNQSPLCWNYILKDDDLVKRGGSLKDNTTELVADTMITGLGRYYDSTVYRTLVKCGTRVYDLAPTGYSHYTIAEIVEAGDAANQLSNWVLAGGDNNNTNNGVLYWKLTDVAGTRTVSLYKNSDGAAGNLVAQGSRAGNGSITLTAQNASGLSGTVTVTYSGDDVTLADNTLTYGVLGATTEVEFMAWKSRGFISDGTDVYSGTTGMFSKVAFLDQDGVALTGEKPKGRVIFVHNERLCYIGDGSKVHMSETDYYDRHQTLLTDPAILADYQVCDKDDGENCVGGCSYDGMIISWKREKMFLITGDPAFSNMEVRRYAKVGLYDQKSVVDCGDGILRWYGAPDGVYEFSTSNGVKRISLDINPEILDSLTDAQRRLVCGGWHDGLYILAYPYGSGVTYCNRAQAYDPQKECWQPLRDWNIARMFRFSDDSTLHAGWSNKGYVKKLFTTNSDDGADIECHYESVDRNSSTERVFDKLKLGIIAGDGGCTIGWITDISSGSISCPAVASLGDKLADKNDAIPSGFMLSDINDLVPEGSLILDINDQATRNLSEFKGRMRAGVRFNKVRFTFHEKSTSPHKLSYLMADTFINREGW
jgi:hypothetical protein